MIHKILHSFYAKPLAVFLAINLFILTSFSTGKNVVLNSGTPVILETLETIHSDSCQVGDIFEFRVRHDVYAEDDIVIAEGAMAKAQVKRIEKAKSIGKPGFVEVAVREVEAVDGQKIPLTGGDLYQDGDGRELEAIVLGLVVCLLFLIIKGRPGIIPAGTLVNASTAGSMTISVN